VDDQPVPIGELNTDRLHFHYRTNGNPNGLPMLLLHGSHASSRWWLPFFDMLPDDIYAVAPDLRGCGKVKRQKPATASRRRPRMCQLIGGCTCVARFDLVAHSSAAAIAVEFLINTRPLPPT
jgi:pimeloyl-ACP methyl ester carboxylesterase